MHFGDFPRVWRLAYVVAILSASLSWTVAAEQPTDDSWSTPGEALLTTSENVLPHLLSLVQLGPNATLPRVTIRAGDGVAKTYVAPRVRLRSLTDLHTKGAISSTFIVTYTGFSPQAQAAFQAAVDIWSQVLVSSVPIRVNAEWKNLGDPRILGSAGPGAWTTDYSYYYPIALAEAIEETDLNSTSNADINASFNSIRTDWYYGTDGNTPSGEYDLMSVVLHELGHGLGFIGLFMVDQGSGICGGTDRGCQPYSYPSVFDQFAEDNLGIALLDGSIYPNESIALGNGLTSDDVYFDGPAAVIANGSAPPQLYAPGSWESGSSYSHLDEYVYPAGDPNSLMTPRLSSAEAVHDPGQITLGIFSDMGWEVVTSLFSDGFESNNTNAWSSTVP